MSSTEKTEKAAEGRRGSIADNELVAAGLSSHDDAEVLGRGIHSDILTQRPLRKLTISQPSLDISKNYVAISP